MHQPYLIPVSVKCILFEDGKVWLRKNERDEWELPGGKLDEGEQPEETAAREALEELGVKARIDTLVGATLYHIKRSQDERRGVFVVAYTCRILARVGDVEHDGEAGRAEFALFSPAEVPDLPMPDFYKRWIALATTMLADT